MVLYGPKQCCMIRAYRCAALDTPVAYIWKKLTPGPLGPKKGPYGPSGGRFLATGPDFGPKIRFLLFHPGFCQWPVCTPRRYLRFGTFGSIFSGRSAARRAVFWPPGRILARKSVFCYRTPNFVNGPFVTLCETVDLAPLDRFLKFWFPSYGSKWPKMA